MSKVSFVCTTYRRFTCVERIVAQYHSQTYDNKELIIFNTDEEFPYSLSFDDNSIIIKNIDNQTNYEFLKINLDLISLPYRHDLFLRKYLHLKCKK